MITRKDQKKAFALIKRIAASNQEAAALTYAKLKQSFNMLTDLEYSMAEGEPKWKYELFMDYVLEVFIWANIESDIDIKVWFEDTDKYLANCIKHRTCAVCGKHHADVHHCDTIGLGGDRTTVDHSKYKRMALCREHHQLCHQKGQKWFDSEFLVYGVLCKYQNDVKDDIDEI